jgi:probable rRNA maturation factor
MIEVRLDDARWAAAGLSARAAAAAAATSAHLGLPEDDVEISLLGCDDAAIAALNAAFRGKSGPTNVLSWPEEDLSADMPGGRPQPPTPDPDGVLALGDIAIAYDTCAREATAGGKPLADHATHLVVHGILHLLGYDHIEDADAALMERLEAEILGKMGLDDPYSGQR